MVTYANNLTRHDAQYTAIVTIEGVGHWLSASDLSTSASEGLSQFSYEVPAYADTSLPIHRPYIADEIDILSEQVDPGGGFPDLGAFSFSVVDVDDYLTGLLRTNRTPTTQLTAALTTGATTVTVSSTTGMSAADTDGGVLYVGSEALKVVSVDSGTQVTVLRGYLGTRAVAHASGAPVKFSIPYLKGRQVTVKLVPQDADDVGEETVQGQYALDGVTWDPSLNVWTFEAKGRLKYLHRQAPVRARQGRVTLVSTQPGIRFEETTPGPLFTRQWTGTQFDSAGGRIAYARLGEEIVSIDALIATTATIKDRGLLGTPRNQPIEVGTSVAQVFLANTSWGAGSFRYSPGSTPSTDRSSGTWNQTDHWVDIMLCIMTSSASESDGYETAGNYTGSYGNFACLPAGYGLGLPASLIDWDTWMDVKARTLDYRFPHFVYGDQPRTFGDLIQEHFLKPMGAYLSVEGGLARIILPRIPLANGTSVTIGPDEILTTEVSPRVLEPSHTVALTLQPAGSITYEVGPDKVLRTYTNADFAATYGAADFYDQDDKGLTIPVPSGDPDLADVYRKRAASRIYREHVPAFEVNVDLAMETSTLAVGDLAAYTLDEMPDMSNGTRGWSGVAMEKLAGEIKVPLDDVAHVRTRLRGYSPDVFAGRTCPAAYVEEYGSDGGGDYIVAAANRYTESDATGGLPTSDAEAFTVGDVVRLVDLDGTDVGGTTQVITSISAPTVYLDGDFGGNLTDFVVLVYAGFDDVSTANGQDTDYAYMADRATHTRGTAGAPNVYGEV